MGKITRAQQRWFGHVQKLSVTRYPRVALKARVDGRKPRGGKRKTKTDNIREVQALLDYTYS